MISSNGKSDKRSLGLRHDWIEQCCWQFVSFQQLALPSSGVASCPVDCSLVAIPESSEPTSCPSSTFSVKETSSSPGFQQKSQNRFSLDQLGLCLPSAPLRVAKADGLC